MRTTSVVRFGRRAAIWAALVWVMAFAGLAAAADITVSKGTGDDAGMFKTIQEAVNAAKPGQVIEILDASVYEEQVTIDGRGEWDKPSEWDNKNQGPVKRVMGGKNGITIKYSPPVGRLFGNHARPTIRWKDTENRSPKNNAESKNEGQQQGQSGNFETCGALRILWAQGVTIDGIKIDGGGLAPFGNADVWGGDGTRYPLFHGNAALTLAVAGGTVIRNCDITNGYFGVNIKDRNTGGVFGNPNRDDNDKTIPLSGFGKVGNHLFEYNKIHNNMTGMFFESSWDLGSTIRYNLIYSNIHNTTAVSGLAGAADNAVGGAILFKDVKYTPIAIYNNTFWNNTGNILGGWKIGAPHLLFNNIFGKPSYAIGTQPPSAVGNAMFEHRFQYRMHNSVFAATADLQAQKRNVQGCSTPDVQLNEPPYHIPGIQPQEITGITQVRIDNNIPNPPTGTTQVTCLAPIDTMKATTTQFIAPGGLITGTVFEATANIRWLETTRSVSGTEDLFVSTDTSSADFLRPKWDHTLVTQFIKNKGWTDIGMKNSDGSNADIGAVPSTGRAPATVARIKPSNVVLVTGTNAKASFFVTVESGELRDAKISFLRWVAPLPTTPPEPSGNQAPPVPKDNIRKLTAPSTPVTVNSNNTMTFTIPQLPAADTAGQYGFFEVVVSGKDANGNDVVSDIGFLPYRKLEYTLKIEVFNTAGTKVTTVNAGEQYRIHVTPCKGSDPATCGSYTDGSLNEVSYELQSDAAAFMYTWNTETPFVQDGPPDAKMGPAGKDYNVYFTRAGAETIMGAGVAPLSNNNRLVFLGTADITVKPGAPAKIIFTDPIPISQLGNANAPVINRGVDKSVTVEVQDKYGNTVDAAVQVSIAVTPNSALPTDCPNCAEVGDPKNISNKTVTTAGTTGVATFTARTTAAAATGKTFEMTASFTSGTVSGSDVGRLRVGRALDRLEVFYSDTTAAGYDPYAKIEGKVGEWFKVTVKDLIGDEVNTEYGNPYVVSVSSGEDGLVFSATEGGASATEFPLTRGVATFWVSSPSKEVNGACIDVLALTKEGGDVFGGINPGGRCEITFIKPSSSIERAIVYGDGHGRPDSLLIYYGDANLNEAAKPSKVSLTWPSLADGVEMTASGAALTVRDELTLHVNLVGASFSGIATQRPSGYTSISGQGRGLVKVYGADAVDEFFDVLDGIGPVLARDNEAGGSNPLVVENLTPGAVDTLIITVSEQIRDIGSWKGATLLYSKEDNPTNEPGASGGTPLNVVDAFPYDGTTYKIVVDPVAGGLAEGDWIRFDPAGGVTDRAAQAGVIEDNKPHPGNRWVRLVKLEVPPTVKDGWYTANPATGKVDYAYVVFDKEINLGRWFTGGSVKFDKDETALTAANLASAFSVSGDTLKIDLSVAFKSSQSAVRTSSPMSIALNFASGTTWGAVNVNARDKAAPVLADAVILKIGSLKDDGAVTPDTLVVVFSETPDEASLGLPNPVTIYTRGGECKPDLKINGPVVPVGGSLYYRATYLIEGALEDWCTSFPEVGDSVSINAGAGFGDNVKPDNNKVIGYNLKQPLKIERDLKWTVKVKSNPFRSGDSRFVGVNLSPSAKGLTNVNVSAKIMIFDNLGALVLDTLVKDGGTEVDWKWEGTNKKGRRVGTGTYLFKAVCEAAIKSEGGAGEQRMPPYAVTRSLGVVRGKE